MSSSSSSSGGIGFLGLLTIVFIVLKLGGWTEVVTWSWWWVLSPMWAGPVLAIVVIFVCGLIFKELK